MLAIVLLERQKGFDKPISLAGGLLLSIIVLVLVVSVVSSITDAGLSQLISISESAPTP